MLQERTVTNITVLLTSIDVHVKRGVFMYKGDCANTLTENMPKSNLLLGYVMN